MRALVVEDDIYLIGYLKKCLEREGFAVDPARSGTEGLTLARENTYDIILLDIMLPGLSGYEFCGTLRKEGYNEGIIMVTAKGMEEEILQGFDNGADDYMVKPFSVAVLSARIRAVLKRLHGTNGHGNTSLRVGSLTMDLLTHRVSRDSKAIPLTRKEFELLEYFMRNPRRTLSPSMIEQHVWDREFEPTSNIVQVQIKHLREKINEGFTPSYIHTVRGFGYCFEEP